MPFDSGLRDLPIVVDPLQALGITPVPEALVADYKAQYRTDFMASKPIGPGPFEWRTTMRFSDLRLWLIQAGHKRITLDLYLAIAIPPAAPRVPFELIDLAKRVQRAIPHADFSVDYFYTDPVLNVHYPFEGAEHTACLGIWDRSLSLFNHKRIVMMGSMVPDETPRQWSFRRLFGLR